MSHSSLADTPIRNLICDTPGQLSYGWVRKPTLTTGNALLKIRQVGICGTDLHAFTGTQPYFTYPRILGHEIAAEFVGADEPTDFRAGEAITVLPYINCGHCIACRSGKPNCCVSLQVIGVHLDGALAEYISVPTRLLVHGEGLSNDELALVEPLAVGAHSIRRAGVQPGEFVLVIGAGPIGLGIMAFASRAGGTVIALDLNESRLDFCRQHLPVHHTINGATEAVSDRLQAITNGDMPTVVIDATGSLRAMEASFAYVAHGGRYILVGLQSGAICFSHPEFHKREATLMSSRNATRADFEQVIASLKTGVINPSAFITHRVRFDQAGREFAGWLNPDSGVIKAMVNMP